MNMRMTMLINIHMKHIYEYRYTIHRIQSYVTNKKNMLVICTSCLKEVTLCIFK